MSPVWRWTVGLAIGGVVTLAACVLGLFLCPRPIENPMGLLPHLLLAAVGLLQLLPIAGAGWLIADLPLRRPWLRALWKTWLVLSTIALLPGAVTVLALIAIGIG